MKILKAFIGIMLISFLTACPYESTIPLGNAKKSRDEWYSDRNFLSLSSPLCICTNTMALVVFSLADRLEICFLLILFLGNAWLVGLQTWKVLRYRVSLV